MAQSPLDRFSLTKRCRTLGRHLWRRLRRTRHLAAPPYAGVIREAERCQGVPERARRFRESGGVDRLWRAIEAAEADDHDEWVDRGRAAQRSLTGDPDPAEPIYRPSEKRG